MVAIRTQYLFVVLGHGTIITSHDKLSHYLSLLTNQFPIESNFIALIADNLNAEISLGKFLIDWSYHCIFKIGLKWTYLVSDCLFFGNYFLCVIHFYKNQYNFSILSQFDRDSNSWPSAYGSTTLPLHHWHEPRGLETFLWVLLVFININVINWHKVA